MAHDNPGLDSKQKLELHQLCQRFEIALRNGQQPAIESYLADGSTDLRPWLVHRLVQLELDYQERMGETLDLSQYLSRFPQYEESVRESFGDRTIRVDRGHTTHIERQLRAGTQFGRYCIEQEVAQGGMGLIYRVHDEQLNRSLALKVLRLEELQGGGRREPDALEVARFMEEAHITAQLDHPGIVPVHELGDDLATGIYFTMSLVKGNNLREVFDLASQEKDGWNLPRALGVVVKACDAIAYAHSRRVIHRDLKPANIMVGRFGAVYVMDWGLAKIADRADLHDIRPQPDRVTTRTRIQSTRKPDLDSDFESPLITMDGSVVGTPAFMPPEQAMGLVAEVDELSDIYSLGAILYNLLTGHPPYVESSNRMTPHTILGLVINGPPRRVSEINPEVPAELLAICEKAMAREKKDRYSSSLELAEELQSYLDGRVVRAFQTGPVAELKSWVARNRTAACSIVAAASLSVVGIFLGSVLAIRAGHLREVERLTELQQYVRDMDVATQFWNAGNVAWARGLTQRYDAPSDFRSFEWHHLTHLTQQSEDAVLQRLPHDEVVTAAEFSSDGKLLATGCDGGNILIWDVTQPDQELRILRDQESWQTIRELRFVETSLGLRLISADHGGNLCVWKPTTDGSGPVRLNAPVKYRFDSSFRNCLTVSSDGKYLAVTSDDNSVLLWKLDEVDRDPKRLQAHEQRVNAVKFAPDGELLTASDDGTVGVWRVESGEMLDMLHDESLPTVPIANLDVSVDGKVAAIAGDQLRIFDLTTRKLVGQAAGNFALEDRLVFSASGARVAAVSDHGEVMFFRIDSDASVSMLPRTIGHRGPVKRLLPLAGNRMASIGGTDNELRLWDSEGGTLKAALRGHGNQVYCLAASLDGDYVATGGRDSHVHLWDASTEHAQSEIPRPSQWWWCVWSLAFSADGRTLIAGDGNGVVRLWDVAKGEFAGYLPSSKNVDDPTPVHEGKTFVGVLPEEQGGLVVTVGDRNIKLWDLAERRLIREVRDAHRFGSCMTVSPNGQRLFVGDDEGKVREWQIPDLSERGTLIQLQGCNVWGLACSQDYLAFGGTDNGVHIWSLREKRRVQILEDHTDNVSTLAFSGDGMLLASGSHDGTVRLWRVDTEHGRFVPAPHSPFRGHTVDVIDVVFSPDGRTLMSTGFDEVVRIWDLETGSMKAVLEGHRSWVFSLAVSPSGMVLASGGVEMGESHDAMIRLWRTSSAP